MSVNSSALSDTSLRGMQANITCITSCFVAIANLFAFMYFMNQWRKKRAIHFLIVLTLAGSDLTTGLSFLIAWIVSTSKGDLQDTVTCAVLGFTATAFVVWSGEIIMILCTQRFFSVLCPTKYPQLFTKKYVSLCLAISLVFGCLHTSYPFYNGPKFHFYESNGICAMDFAPGNGNTFHRGMLGFIAVFYLIMLIIETCLSITMVKQVYVDNKHFKVLDGIHSFD